MVQLSFTLPVPADARAREVGRAFVANLGLREPQIVHAAEADREMTFFIAYAKAAVGVDPDAVEATEVEAPRMGFDAINDLIERELGRPIVVVGAAIESDAHTVGIDAIMNMKGFAGDYGLERYPWIRALNMGAQVPCERLLREAVEYAADAILVSQVVTQRDVHKENSRAFIEEAKAAGIVGKMT